MGMLRTLRKTAALMLAFGLSACGLVRGCAPAPISPEAFEALHAAPSPAPSGPLAVYHLGHSLVGRDMPAMLAQLAPDGHRYDSQLGWGVPLKAHWEPDVPINGFDRENAHPRYRDAHEAIGSGAYDAVVLTEMVEIRDAIQYHDTPEYVARWARAAWEARPDAQLYFYESWHRLDDPEGWLERLDRDLDQYWIGEILRGAQAREGVAAPIRLVPVGQVFAAVTRAVEAVEGGVDGLASRTDLFGKAPDGTQDMIHFSDLGAYLTALTHYAVLYQQSPVGLPRQLARADGLPADAPGPAAARLMQEIVWDVVTRIPATGVPAAP